MLFDDRLTTVLRHRAHGELAARTQYRQLLDLLGRNAGDADDGLVAAGMLRLLALARMIPAPERTRLVADAAPRIRNPNLLAELAEDDADVAAAALGAARLTEAEWVRTIPELPVRARGFLRHRRDLPAAAVAVLDRLGVQDRVLPQPDILELVEEPADDAPVFAAPEPAPLTARKAGLAVSGKGDVSIGALVERIQAYTRARETTASADDAPRLPLGESDPAPPRRLIEGFVARIDRTGRIDLAEPEIASMVVGSDLLAGTGAVVPRGEFARAFRNRLPVRGAPIELAGSPRIAGTWLIDAAPRFHSADGRFAGYAARLRRPVEESAAERAESAADRIRQLLHELRTPVNAIQGFAEIIQQQVFGPTPHEYRALAAGIAGDAARMLAGFDELDRLARLESAALRLEPGRSDFAGIAKQQVGQLQTVLAARVSRFDAKWPDGPATLPVTDDEAQMLAWRIFATIASATGAGEALALDFAVADGRLAMRCDLPAGLATSKDIFSTDTRPAGGAVSAGIFGAGFALRLARAEARAAGGDLVRRDERLLLTLPLLTAAGSEPSERRVPDRASG